MKSLIFLLLFFPYLSNSQNVFGYPIDSTTKKFIISEIVKVDSISSQVIYSKANVYIANYFKDKYRVTSKNDDASKSILYTGSIKAFTTLTESNDNDAVGYISFAINLQAKEGRYKFTVSDFYYWDNSFGINDKFPLEMEFKKEKQQKRWKMIRDMSNINITNFISDMKKSIAKKEDW
jgi:uncharacterized membrane protein